VAWHTSKSLRAQNTARIKSQFWKQVLQAARPAQPSLELDLKITARCTKYLCAGMTGSIAVVTQQGKYLSRLTLFVQHPSLSALMVSLLEVWCSNAGYHIPNFWGILLRPDPKVL